VGTRWLASRSSGHREQVRLREVADGALVLASLRRTPAFACGDSLACQPKLGEAERRLVPEVGIEPTRDLRLSGF
jgi:hypothetical protein